MPYLKMFVGMLSAALIPQTIAAERGADMTELAVAAGPDATDFSGPDGYTHFTNTH